MYAHGFLRICQPILGSVLVSDVLIGSDNFRRFRRLCAWMGQGAHSVFLCRVDWIAACARKTPEAARILIARLEQVFANFAQVPYHDVRALQEFEKLLDDLEDLIDPSGSLHT